MSIFGGIRRGARTPVTEAQYTRNDKQEKGEGSSSIIKSAEWSSPQAGVGGKANIVFELHRQPANLNAVIQVLFNSPDGTVHPFDNPINVKVTAKRMSAAWDTKAPKMKEWSKGSFSFRLTVDNETKTSGMLKLTDDAVARYVQRITTDGFDGPVKK
jgi:hypothetical protein